MKRTEHGFTTVFVGLTLVAMLIASAFAIDLGQAYAARRQMQNSADAAAMAGARALYKTRTVAGFASAVLTDAVLTAVRTTALSNGASSATGQVTCTLIGAGAVPPVLGGCSTSALWAAASGVRVTTAVTNNTAFARVISQNTLTARASAAAQVRPLVSSTGSPFIVCGNALKGGQDILTPAGAIKPTAITNSITHLPAYILQFSQAKDCNAGVANFKGKTQDSQTPMSVGQWLNIDNGNGNDHGIYDTVAGATPCPSAGPFTDCDLVIPIADDGRLTSGGQLHIAAFGVFHLQGDGSGNPKYTGWLLAPTSPVTRGQGGLGVSAVGAACVLKLVS